MTEKKRRKPLRIAIRADGGGPVGFGHLSRCSSLAKALSRQCAVPTIEFWCRENPMLAEFLAREGFGYNPIPVPEEEQVTRARLEAFSPDVLILDMAEHVPDMAFEDWTLIERQYSDSLISVAPVSVQLDDFAIGDFKTSLVVNGGVVDHYTSYGGCVAGEILKGPEYVLLRPEFTIAARKLRDTSEHVKSILIVDCGQRFTHHVPRFLYAFEKHLDSPRLKIVSRDFAENPNRMNTALDVELIPAVQDMAGAMLDCDLAVTCGGTILYELAATGTPAIVMPAVDHQEAITAEFDRLGTVVNMGKRPEGTDFEAAVQRIIGKDSRLNMINKGRTLVDGMGADRVAKRIVELVAASEKNR